MARPRTHDRHLPRYVTHEHGAYYYRGKDRKRVRLGEKMDVALARFARLMEAEQPRDPGRVLTDERYVYVVGIVGTHKPVKIGLAANLKSRLSDLQVAHHYPLEYRASYLFAPRARAKEIERLAHKNFRKWHRRGEWFDIASLNVTTWIEEAFAGEILSLEPALESVKSSNKSHGTVEIPQGL